MTNPDHPPFPETRLAAEAGATLVVERGDGKFAELINANGHVLLADEPAASGGGGGGPSPYDLLLAALGSCTAMTIRLYADFKKIPLKRVAVRLSIREIHAEDCRDCETREGQVSRIRREIELQGELSGEQKEKMLAIANKCPVARTLTREIKIDSVLTA
jgi:uncharacterized OsmC-like protein